MFKGITNRWKEARADVVRPGVETILKSYCGYGWYERYELLSAFDYTKNDLEDDHGNIAEWSKESQDAVVKQLKEGAKQGGQSASYGASGMYLLSLYIDLHTIPGENADRLKKEIDAWHQTAIQTDLETK